MPIERDKGGVRKQFVVLKRILQINKAEPDVGAALFRFERGKSFDICYDSVEPSPELSVESPEAATKRYALPVSIYQGSCRFSVSDPIF